MVNITYSLMPIFVGFTGYGVSYVLEELGEFSLSYPGTRWPPEMDLHLDQPIWSTFDYGEAGRLM